MNDTRKIGEGKSVMIEIRVQMETNRSEAGKSKTKTDKTLVDVRLGKEMCTGAG